MELSKSRINYIIAIRQLAGGQVSQKNICEYLGIKKSTASIALKFLDENGYIKKQEGTEGNEYYITEKSQKIIDDIEKEKFEFMFLFSNFLGINHKICEREYNSLCGEFSKEFINELSILKEKGCYFINKAEKSTLQSCSIANGTYEIPFQVVKCGQGVRSMGDKGFVHPAMLIVSKQREDILLKSREIYYKAKNGQVYKGQLKELYYLDIDMKWVLSQQESESTWIIPFNKILYQNDNYGGLSIGSIKIKALSTNLHMPESIAEITFNYKLSKKVLDN